MATDHCFGPVGLHRVEVDIRPENVRSRRVAEKLGFREEGLYVRYLDIDGGWRDHVSYALTVEDVPERAAPAAARALRLTRGDPRPAQPELSTRRRHSRAPPRPEVPVWLA